MTQNVIVAERVYNVKYNNMGWRVFITGMEETENCKPCVTPDPYKALRYMFLLKARSKKFIDADSIALLKCAVTLVKKSAPADETTPTEGGRQEETAVVETAKAEEPETASTPSTEQVEEVKKPRSRKAKKEVKAE